MAPLLFELTMDYIPLRVSAQARSIYYVVLIQSNDSAVASFAAVEKACMAVFGSSGNG
jgi:hypothetical protein